MCSMHIIKNSAKLTLVFNNILNITILMTSFKPKNIVLEYMYYVVNKINEICITKNAKLCSFFNMHYLLTSLLVNHQKRVLLCMQ